ncbi:MAG: ATPase, T2SS/T4P/T4SS family [Gemmatimonadales bacterium]|jgi:type II secretory ATPase GspE/PulE/Tfp pilus assembly ATPase PilB-like protein/CheY-like chemotaxis protein
MNWLINAAEKAGWQATSKPSLQVATALEEAWRSVTEAYAVSEPELAAQVATLFRIDVAPLEEVEARAVKLVPEKLARKHHVLPIHETQNEIVIATSDPTDYNAEQAVQFTSGRRVVQKVAGYQTLLDCINAHYSPERAMEGLLRSMDARISDVKVVESEAVDQVAASEAEAAPVIQLTNMILHAAIAANASDIHLEPGRHQGIVRFRVDGVMRQYMQLPLVALTRVVSRIKVIAKLDIADRLRPQDGRTRIAIAGKTFDMRISTVPTREAEKAVIRILNPETSRSLDDLGLAQQELARLKYLLSFREGIVIVTGPTGSGKTTTLYGGVRELAAQAINIMTVEDPVEYELPGVTQIQIDPKRDVTFASALRAILRQDPDVVFVGEIRDDETAKIALQAAATGHLVLSTLHTNDAVGAVQRLIDLGLDRATLAPSLRGVVGQRLIRKLCRACSMDQPDQRDAGTVRLERAFGVRQTRRAVGCKECGETGYLGRMPLDEVLVNNADFQEQLARNANSADLQRAAERGGMRPIREVALAHVVMGNTTLAEVERVLGEGEVPSERPDERPRILVVDDDPVTRELAVGVLKASGFTVEHATDGQAAIDMLAHDPRFSLMTLDLNMPRLDGLDVLRQLRSSASTSGLPIVVLTSTDCEETEINLMNEGADDYLRKPLDPARFVARVRAVLRRASS